LGLANLSTKRQRIAELARAKSGVALSTLHHVLDLEWMREAYRLTRKDGVSGAMENCPLGVTRNCPLLG
jgi:hypothetical protein